MAKRVVPGSLTQSYTKRAGDFSPDLVGNQLTSKNGDAFFTFGNFSLTTGANNFSGEFFTTEGEFSELFTLDNLNLTLQQAVDISNQSNSLEVVLKTNPNKLKNYVYFSDARKFVETEIVDIVTNWKGSLFVRFSYINDTVNDFQYDLDKNISYFTVSRNVIENQFNLITENLPNVFTTNDYTDISFIQNNFTKYEINNSYGKFPIISYTGNTETDDYIKIQTSGLVWPTLYTSGLTSGSFEYHIKPNDETLNNIFFNKISEFQRQLLNRNSIPKYTIELDRPTETINGVSNNRISFTWPTNDGYNIDYTGRDYANYIENLLKFAANFDAEITNIMVRKLVATAIFEFDTPGDGTDPNSGRKMDKLVKIWGREYDKIKLYIDNISFANVVTYDGVDNMPDELIKMMAQNLGFDSLQSFSDNNLIKFLQTSPQGVFNPNGVSPSLAEMDRELWRRLVINAWWLFKSKGTRKVIEFFLNLFNIDQCLISFDEVVYLAEKKLNYPQIITQMLTYLGYVPEDSQIGIDQEGYPKIFPNTDRYYFQLNGFWYNGGTPENTKPNVNGNNPHFGPYDFGRAYFEKYTCLIPNFEPTQTTINLNLLTFNYFTDYTLGTIESGGQTIIEGNNLGSTTTTGVGNILNTYNDFYATVMNEDRVNNAVVLNAGSDNETSNNGLNSFHINFFTGNEEGCEIEVCPTNTSLDGTGLITYIQSGQVLVLESNYCCEKLGFNNYLNIEDGTYPCYWCPPSDSLTEVTQSNGDIWLYYTDINQQVSKPLDKACCIKRGGQAGTNLNGTKFCKKIGITVDPILVNG
jgi:hypothetical protein